MSPERIGTTLGVWRLDRLVGSGGMGDVFLAHRIDGVVQQTRAVKVLREAYRQGGRLNEADTLSALDHPNIARCFDVGLTDDLHRYLVMEYVEGLAITDYADQHALTIHERLELFLGVCAAVEYSHQRLVMHLDLKPGNILVNQSGAVKVVDFGIACRLEGPARSRPDGAFSGPYASPELIQPGSRLGFQTDIYALGAVLYELLCGHEPFDPLLSAGELERQILEEIPMAPSNALQRAKLKQSDAGLHFRLEPDALARMRGCRRFSEVRRLIAGDLDCICLFALRKHVGRRYRSVDDLRSDLARVLQGRKPAIARSGDPLFTVMRAARRSPLAIFGVLALLTAALSAFTFFQLFAAGRSTAVASGRQLDRVSEASLEALRGELRPQLAARPDARDSLRALDEVLRTASQTGPPKSQAGKLLDQLFLLAPPAGGKFQP